MYLRFAILAMGGVIAALVLRAPQPLAHKAPGVPVSLDESAYVELQSLSTPPPSALRAAASTTLPILVYHIVRPRYASDRAAVRAIALTPAVFDAELAHLQTAGYHVVGFSELESYFASSTPLPPKPIILSFDDGWRDQFAYAFPILQKYHDTATFFVFTNAIGRRGFLTWDNLRTLRLAGMTIGDHTRSHPYLTHITDSARLWDEIHGSKQLLERQLKTPVTVFAYPFGQYNASTTELVRMAGFTSARGDYWFGSLQTRDRLYGLSALNAPTSTTAFDQRFP